MTIFENTASSAGYPTGGTLVSAFAAYIIVKHQSISVLLMLAWVFFIAVLGITMAIPMKRQMINIEQLASLPASRRLKRCARYMSKARRVCAPPRH
jgi:uncharacterized oligopeptide transporter (OPT) family protein